MSGVDSILHLHDTSLLSVNNVLYNSTGKCPNVTSLTPLIKGSDVPTKVPRTFIGAWKQFWPNVQHRTLINYYKNENTVTLFSSILL